MDYSKMKYSLDLHGDWDFYYSRSQYEDVPKLVEEHAFETVISVPGYWDEQTDAFRNVSWRENVELAHVWKSGEKESYKTLTYIKGLGWYRKHFNLGEIKSPFRTPSVLLEFGEILYYAHIWINRQYAGAHHGHRSGFCLDITEWCNIDGENEIILAVGNDRIDTTACPYPDGFCGGILGKAGVRIAGNCYMEDLFVRAGKDLKTVAWTAKISALSQEPCTVVWEVIDDDRGIVLAKGLYAYEGKGEGLLDWNVEIEEIQPWDVDHPKLYTAVAKLICGTETMDMLRRRFGMKQLVCRGTKLLLNGRSIYARANCWTHHFPEHCSAPYDKAYYAAFLKRLKELGFNMAKFLYAQVPDACLEAADEIGMLVQVSVCYFPNDMADDSFYARAREEMAAYIKYMRNHVCASVIRLSGEYYCYDRFISRLKDIYGMIKEHHPQMLVIPSHAVAGLNYQLNLADKDLVGESGFLYNTRVFRELDQCTDIVGFYSSGILSYNCPGKFSWKDADRESAIYERPLFSHENGMKASYIDLGNEKRYTGRIPPRYYIEAREQLEAAGLLDKAGLYYDRSSRIQQIARKYCIEEIRLSRLHAGYEYLGSHDHFSASFSYAAGFLNEFGELKPGDSIENILQYQNDSVLLLDFPDRKIRTYACGEEFSAVWTLSHYGKKPVENGTLFWQIRNEKKVFIEDERQVGHVENGRVSTLAPLCIRWPDMRTPVKVTLYGCFEGGGFRAENTWDFWIFPAKPAVKLDAYCEDELYRKIGSRYIKTGSGEKGQRLRIVSSLKNEDIRHLAGGGAVVLFGTDPFPSWSLGNPLAVGHASRRDHNLGTLVFSHPVTDAIPNEGYGDWQFHPLMLPGETKAVYFNNPDQPLDIPFSPIIEVISSDKHVRKQAILFETRVDSGRLLVFTGSVNTDSAVNRNFLDALFAYAGSESFRPKDCISSEVLYGLLQSREEASSQSHVAYRVNRLAARKETGGARDILRQDLWQDAACILSARTARQDGMSLAQADYHAGEGVGAGDVQTLSGGGKNRTAAGVRFVNDDVYLYTDITVKADWFSEAPDITYYDRPANHGDDSVFFSLGYEGSPEMQYLLTRNAEGVFLSGEGPVEGHMPFADILKDSRWMEYRLMIPLPSRKNGMDETTPLLVRIIVRHKPGPEEEQEALVYDLALTME